MGNSSMFTKSVIVSIFDCSNFRSNSTSSSAVFPTITNKGLATFNFSKKFKSNLPSLKASPTSFGKSSSILTKTVFPIYLSSGILSTVVPFHPCEQRHPHVFQYV